MLLYIHIPFCDSKCFYCAFNSYTSLHSLRDDYMEALKVQLKDGLTKNNKKIETIFIGGGTPSTIKASKYQDVMNIVKPYLVENDKKYKRFTTEIIKCAKMHCKHERETLHKSLKIKMFSLFRCKT